MKKKVLSLCLSAAVVVTMLTGSMSAFADDDITVTLDGQAIEFDVQPQIIDGRTMVPLRKIFEEIGAVVKWNGETQTVSARKNSKTISMVINSSDMQIDKGDTDNDGNPIYETVTLDVPSQIIDGRTLVPARAISEAFGLNVDWDGVNKNVTITSDEDDDDTWKENTGTINLDDLTYTGEGVEISDNEIKITLGGDFTITGMLDDGNITVNTTEKVKLRLSGASITSSTNPCIYVENADKAYITITDGTENNLTVKDNESDAIYAKDNLEIKGDGTLNITANGGHAIKASDNLTIENGIIDIVSSDDAINATGGKTGSMMGGGGRGEMTPSQNGGERPEFNGFDKVNKGEKNPNGDMMMPNTNRGNRPIPGENGDIQPPEFQNGENRPQNGVMMGGNMKDCLVINGGNIEAVAGDDCLDSNGNIVLNGGTIKAVKENGTFTGANSVIDPDGTLTVGENVTLVLVSRGGTDRGGRNGNSGGLSLLNNAIYLYSETSHNANESITLKNSSGEILAEYLPKAVYSAVLITSPDIEIGEEYVLSVGSETHNVTISEQNTNIGTQPTSQGFGDRPQRMPVLN